MNKNIFPRNIISLFFLLSVFFFSCTNKKNSNISERKTYLFSEISPEESGIDFINSLEETKEKNIFSFWYFYNGSGVSIGDINNDGLADIYFSGNQKSGRLYLNKGNFKFEDITNSAGVETKEWCTGVSMVDVNNDGYLDIYVCKSGKYNTPQQRANLLFINNKNNTFTERAAEYGIDNKGYSTSGTFFDIDNDGDMDLYLANEFLEPFDKAGSYEKEKNQYDEYSTPRLFENNGKGKFTDISEKAGVLIKAFNLSATVADFNKDGYTDLYVCNDFYMPDRLLINNKDNTFSDSTYSYFSHTSKASMGSDIADINNDGFLDLMTTEMAPEKNHRFKALGENPGFDSYNYFAKTLSYGDQYNRNVLQLNNGNRTYSDIANLAGVARTDWSWAVLFADFDNDGYKDIFVANGFRKEFNNKDFVTYSNEENRKLGKVLNRVDRLKIIPEIKVQNYFFKNNNNLTFSKKSDEWGILSKTYSYGAAYADLDNDGDLDLIACNIDAPPSIYKNNSEKHEKNNFFRIKFKGRESNFFGEGCKLTLTSKLGMQYQEMTLNRGYQSTVEPIMHFGLKKDSSVIKLKVVWPSGKTQELYNLPVNKLLVLDEANSKKPELDAEVAPKDLYLKECDQSCGINFIHKENEYIDYKREPLLPHICSRNGPAIAVGDVNNDGKDDFFIGGAQFSGGGELFLQKADGKFFKAPNQPWKTDRPASEDMGCLFFDADNDGDADLYIVSGGSEYDGLSENYQDRLYKNQGSGNFVLDNSSIPVVFSSGSTVVASDFDSDGDQDLFVGGRILPGSYPLAPRSYILINNHGEFIDETSKICPGLLNPGLVTSALWTDFNNDGKQDLIVSGEWMPILFFENKMGKLVNVSASTGLGTSTGWWNSISGGDFDNDGDIDYVLGNQGLNSWLKSSPQEPLTLHVNDYDKNKSIDAILCYNEDGKNYPFFNRDELALQIREIRKTYLRNADFADVQIEKLFNKIAMAQEKIFSANYFESSYLENLGSGKFKLTSLPIRAQLGPIYGTKVFDFDQDGNLDVMLVGNSLSTSVDQGRDDAFKGLLLHGNGNGGFQEVLLDQSGFFVPGDAKAVSIINADNKLLFLVSRNNDKILSFELKGKHKLIKLKTDDNYALVSLKGGKQRKIEFYNGSGYLSEDSRVIDLNDKIIAISVFNNNNKKREIVIRK